ncbi:hypothetical protein SD71_03200 [Cohnella kolymensis]|uniref:Uncharacterized protein n=1 Tax=Cohnella kolymensis TaxID=1590652 RepID=A0ABR5A9B0_9BACL|nr:hypothetical protein [Cohnella kolymensis]KIL37620.1 hypothetical protein SD71_03200 [Cohnella kolymensis]
MTEREGAQTYQLWVKAWNEDASVLDKVTAPDCAVHQARTDGKSKDDRKGAEALKGIISDGCAFFKDVKMDIEVGPIVDGPYIFLLERGKFKDYWVSSDGVHLM